MIFDHRETSTPLLCDSTPRRNENSADQSIIMLSVLGNPRQLAAQILNFGMALQPEARLRAATLTCAGIRSDSVNGFHDVERVHRFCLPHSSLPHANVNRPQPLRCHRLALPHRRRPVWVHGTGIPARRPSVPLYGSPESSSLPRTVFPPNYRRHARLTACCLLIGNRNLIAETDVGEVVVYNVRDKDIPIVHRVVRKFGEGYETPWK